MSEQEIAIQTFNEGFQEWKRFCGLMDKYPEDSFAKIQLRMLDVS